MVSKFHRVVNYVVFLKFIVLDEIFTFCLYGEDERQVYDNQYPYRYFGLRCSSYCLLM